MRASFLPWAFPLSILLASCGPPDEIRSENELGEYVLAKTETLAIEPYLFPKKQMLQLYEDVTKTYENYTSCLQDRILSEAFCSSNWLDNNYKQKLERYNFLVNLEKESPGKKPAIQIIKWRGIAKEVGSERVKIERSAYCFNPELTPQMRAKWERASGEKGPMPDEEDKDDLGEKVEAELCRLYAKF